MKKFLLALVVMAVIFGVSTTAWAGSSSRGCSSCHTPHWAAPETDTDYGVPLYNPYYTEDGLPTYELYTSRGFDALNTDIRQPDGPSKLCLGCHDGTNDHTTPGHSAFGAADLKRSHPISFTYDAALVAKTNGKLFPVTNDSGLGDTIERDLLDSRGKVQCTSCHQPHVAQGDFEYHLKYESQATLCKTCHNM